MNHTTSPTAQAITQPNFADAWRHLDQLYPDDGELLLTAEKSVAEAARALRSGAPIDRAQLAEMMATAAGIISDARGHIGRAVVELGELELEGAGA